MSENSKIEWTDHTWSPWEGCQKVGPGCDHCYAEARNSRFGGGQPVNWGPGAPRREMSPAYWKQPIKWNAQAAAASARQRVFPSLCDPFDNAVDVHLRRKFFDLIELTPWLTWLLLTKRIGNAFAMLSDARSHDWLAGQDNVWIGATVVNQEEADRDIPKLLALPARVRFLSMEPLLGPVDLRLQRPARDDDRQDMDGWCSHITTAAGADIKWVIVGGESGPKARPMHPDWARSLRDQCASAGVPFLFKQWGEWLPWSQFCDAGIDDPPEQTRFETREHADGAWSDVGKPDYWATMDGDIDDEQCVGRVGKKAAGRLLDGVEHNGVPA